MRAVKYAFFMVSVGLLLSACPQDLETDAGALDAGLSDTAILDSNSSVDANPDAGCEQACGTAGEDSLTVEGECQGNLLRYCENNCVVERDCQGMAGGPYSCGLYGPFYECLAGAGQDYKPQYWDCDPLTNCTGNQPCDEGAGLHCETRGSSFICVTGEAVDAGELDAASAEDASPADANAPDTASVSDSAVSDSQSADAETADVAVADVAAVDSNSPDAGSQASDAQLSDLSAGDAASEQDTGTQADSSSQADASTQSDSGPDADATDSPDSAANDIN